MTVREYLKQNKKELRDVRVFSYEWSIQIIDYTRKDCGCLNQTIIKIVDDKLYVD